MQRDKIELDPNINACSQNSRARWTSTAMAIEESTTHMFPIQSIKEAGRAFISLIFNIVGAPSFKRRRYRPTRRRTLRSLDRVYLQRSQQYEEQQRQNGTYPAWNSRLSWSRRKKPSRTARQRGRGMEMLWRASLLTIITPWIQLNGFHIHPG